MSERSRRQGAVEAPSSLPMGHPLGEVGDEWLPGAPTRPREDGDRTAAAPPTGKHTPSRNLAYGDYWVEKDGADGGSGRNGERNA
ncbi:hypothetical protein G3I60_05870 [Streptomyces sp. SID13666]|uniref:hypothetical protein n=1 Tax=unclassified Streptomyces TaxID=2593676 RepID=UPI0013C0E107|nr:MULTISPECIES: hypothetical protein [unclassified Streptomyces]NEA53695.1 hypothetical protein [Streptomyces sp. SID13666]NEA71473.1 hypothetical protein [Streptomyces sp. SID13588]